MGVVFVTGGDKGIGKAIVERMATLHNVVIFTYNTNIEGTLAITEELNNVVALQCNLADRDHTLSIAKRVIAEYGGVDILINNAGYTNDSTFVKMEPEQWDSVLDVNLRSVFNLAHSFVGHMIDNGWGRIINLTSIAAFTGAFGKSNYAASKAGIVGFTKSLSMELARKGITINAIAPGAIKSSMLMEIPEKYRAKILENIPAARFGEPEEVADLVEFLSSDKAKYINGQTIHINGGSYL